MLQPAISVKSTAPVHQLQQQCTPQAHWVSGEQLKESTELSDAGVGYVNKDSPPYGVRRHKDELDKVAVKAKLAIIELRYVHHLLCSYPASMLSNTISMFKHQAAGSQYGCIVGL